MAVSSSSGGTQATLRPRTRSSSCRCTASRRPGRADRACRPCPPLLGFTAPAKHGAVPPASALHLPTGPERCALVGRGRGERSALMVHAAPRPRGAIERAGPTDIFSARTHRAAKVVVPVLLGVVYGYWAAANRRYGGPITVENFLFGFLTGLVFA